MHRTGEKVVRIEAQALNDLADRIVGKMADAFNRGVEVLYACGGRVVVTGMGKSGLLARGDVVMALSASGETEEILHLLATIKRLQLPLIAVTCDAVPVSSANPDPKASSPAGPSTLAAAAEVSLSCAVAEEACTLGLAPTASTTAMLALGDALAMALAEKKGFKEEDFANLHPGGKLGKQLARVETLMHTGDAIPQVSAQTKMPDVIYEMSRKKLGITTVVDG